MLKSACTGHFHADAMFRRWPDGWTVESNFSTNLFAKNEIVQHKPQHMTAKLQQLELEKQSARPAEGGITN